MFEQMFLALLTILSPVKLIGLVLGFLLGLVFGIIPGLNSITAVLLVLPFTFGMNPELAFIIMISAYCAALYGGSVPAILFRTPGTSSAMMTSVDGYPLALQGRAGEALSIAAIASSLGGFLGSFFLLFLTSKLADMALSFGPTEYFALAVFGMSAITSMGQRNQLKSVLSMLLGALVASIGVDNLRGLHRFTFNLPHLLSGFQMVPVLVGLFAVSEIFRQISTRKGQMEKVVKDISIKVPALSVLKKMWPTFLRSGLIGLVVGALPGEGSTVACALAYNEEQRWSKNPEQFGAGALAGVAAPEMANNTVAATSLIPTFALGIPGSPTAAALMGAFLMLGLNPGPDLLISRPLLLTTITWTVLFSSILILVFGLLGVRWLAKLVEVPYTIVGPFIMLFSLWGSFCVRNNSWDIFVVLVFGVMGYIMTKSGFPLIAFTLGFILGPLLEDSLLHSLALYDNNLLKFFTRPITAVLLILSFIIVFYPYLRILFRNRRKVMGTEIK